ncbi:MAG: isoleucine--tRNA ligase [Verrucomicrobiales bacterium]|nr:isoleucine--tRNA ligase [Verrucomicrobiales bacterium]
MSKKDGSSSYKDTLNLPDTDFPMRGDLVKREPARLEQWEKENIYRQIIDKRKADGCDTYMLHDGPPFANGDVHMGTALNKVLKDLVLKSKSMAGFHCPYVPGWDCHGLPIEFKVVKEAKGLSPAEIRTRAEKFARKYIDIQRKSFRRLGVFGDWENPYLTLAPEYEADIVRVFATLVDKGLVYQSKKPVQWSYGAQTALAEAEVEYEDVKDPAIFVKFPLTTGDLAGKTSMVIWTTTPWTLPANLGIALHPRLIYVQGEFVNEEKDRTENLVIVQDLIETFGEKTGFVPKGELKEFKGEDLEGEEAQHPFLDRTSKIILADFVTTETGTGAVHVAPGHGADDYVAGQNNNLGLLSPVDDEGLFTDEVGVAELVGEHVFECNVPIIKILAKSGHLIGKENYKHSYPHCWRSKTPIIFRSVPQFFIRIDELREQALKEIDDVTWLPHWGRNRIYGTVESRPDWCISRQRTWGVPLPVFFEDDGIPKIDADIARKVADLIEEGGTNLWFEKDDDWWADKVGLPKGTKRCQDTLDVWIDSGSSHVAVLDRHPELHAPADLYLEATDQHRGWFQSSLMLSTAVRGTAPYKTVMTHGFVVRRATKAENEERRKQGKPPVQNMKVSKSDESGGKPMNAAYFYDKFGADIVRLWAASVDWQNEVPFSEDIFKQTAEPYRRFRNILRILLANLNDFDAEKDKVGSDQFTMIDNWIMERLQTVITDCREAYAEFEFRKVFNTLNQFCANDLSAFYVDITKDRMYCDATDSPRRRATQTVMHAVFESMVKLLAPVLAYTAEEAWEFSGHKTSVHLETFPEADKDFSGTEATDKITVLTNLRDMAQVQVDAAIKNDQFKKRERSAVTFELPEKHPARELIENNLEDVLEFLMVSSVSLSDGSSEEAKASVSETALPECPRCRRSIELAPDHDECCQRCADVVA